MDPMRPVDAAESVFRPVRQAWKLDTVVRGDRRAVSLQRRGETDGGEKLTAAPAPIKSTTTVRCDDERPRFSFLWTTFPKVKRVNA